MRVIIGRFKGFIKFLLLHKSHIKTLPVHLTEDICHGNILIGNNMKEHTVIAGLGQHYGCLCHHVYGRKFHASVHRLIGSTAKCRECTKPSHRGIGFKIHLEFPVALPCRKITITQDLGLKPLIDDSLKDGTFRQELGVYVLIGKVLSEIEHPFIRREILRLIVRVAHLNDTHRGGLNHPRFILQTEIDDIFRSAQIDILYDIVMGKMPDCSSAIDDRIDTGTVELIKGLPARHISLAYEEPVTDQITVAFVEIEEHIGKEPACCLSATR